MPEPRNRKPGGEEKQEKKREKEERWGDGGGGREEMRIERRKRRRDSRKERKKKRRTEKKNQGGLHIDKHCGGRMRTVGPSNAAWVSISCSSEHVKAVMPCSCFPGTDRSRIYCVNR